MSATKSRGKEITADVGAEGSDKGKGQQKRFLYLDNGLIVATRLVKEYKRLIFLNKKIQQKKEKGDRNKSYRSKLLVPYKEEEDKLVEQVHNDISELQLTIDNERGNTFSREDKMRATIGVTDESTRTHHRLNREIEDCEKEKAALILSHKGELGALKEENRNDKERLEAKTNQLTGQLDAERKAKEDALIRLVTKTNELTGQLDAERKAKEDALIRLEAKTNQLTGQLDAERKAKEDALIRLEEEKRKAEDELQRYKENCRKAEDAKIQLEKNVEELNRKKEEYENEKFALNLSHKEELGAHEAENIKLKERLEEEKRKSEYELQRYKENLSKAEDAKIQLEKNIRELNSKKEEYENEKVAIHLSHKEELRAHKAENIKLKERLEEDKRKSEYERQRLEAKTNQLTGQVDAERKAKEDALIRLSSMASNKLRDNNPNIADLSDPNRPTKLSEQFSELYDNEWTDAFDELEKELKIELKEEEKMETKIISYLRDILLEIHSMCSGESLQRLKGIEEACVKPFDNIKVPTEVFKMIKDAIKSMAPYCLEGIRKVVFDQLVKMFSKNPVAGCLEHKNVKRYIDKCTDVCWYMSVQDPQVFMDGTESPNGNFDSNKHREYTKKGPYEEYVVWPVLYLYKDGQMLSKGVAQGTKMENKNEMTEHQ